jgi:hypothetical protein
MSVPKHLLLGGFKKMMVQNLRNCKKKIYTINAIIINPY